MVGLSDAAVEEEYGNNIVDQIVQPIMNIIDQQARSTNFTDKVSRGQETQRRIRCPTSSAEC